MNAFWTCLPCQFLLTFVQAMLSSPACHASYLPRDLHRFTSGVLSVHRAQAHALPEHIFQNSCGQHAIVHVRVTHTVDSAVAIIAFDMCSALAACLRVL